MKEIICTTLGFIGFDFVTGFIGAMRNGKVKSQIMREGLYHKTSLIILIAFSILAEYGQKSIFKELNIPILLPICGYIVIMETTSIIENLCKINPSLIPSKIKGFFGFIKEEKKDDENN